MAAERGGGQNSECGGETPARLAGPPPGCWVHTEPLYQAYSPRSACSWERPRRAQAGDPGMQGPRLRQKGDDRDPGGQRSKEDRSEGTAQWLPWPPYTHAPLNAQVPASYTHPLTVTLTCLHHPPHTHPLTALTLTPGTHASTHPPVGARRVPGVDTRIQPLASKRTDTHTHARVLARSLMFLHAHRQHTGLSSCRSPPGPQALWLPDVQVPGRLRAPTPTLAVHADGLYRAHPAQRWGHGFGGLSLLSFPPGTLPGPPPSVSPSLSPQPHSLARHWDMHPEASQQSPGLSPPRLACPGIAQLPPRPSGLDLGARAALGAHPPRTHSASHLDWARGLRGSRGAQEDMSPAQL